MLLQILSWRSPELLAETKCEIFRIVEANRIGQLCDTDVRCLLQYLESRLQTGIRNESGRCHAGKLLQMVTEVGTRHTHLPNESCGIERGIGQMGIDTI